MLLEFVMRFLDPSLHHIKNEVINCEERLYDESIRYDG